MRRPVFGETTIRDEKVYRIDHDTTEDDAHAETALMAAASAAPSPMSSTYAPASSSPRAVSTFPSAPAPRTLGRERHPFAQTMRILPRP